MVYNPPHKSHDSILLGAQMNSNFHIWVSACVVLTYTQVKHFQKLHLKSVNCNIETTNLDRNKNQLGRVYLLHPSIHLAFGSILFSCFQLDIVHPFGSLKTIQTWISCHQ